MMTKWSSWLLAASLFLGVASPVFAAKPVSLPATVPILPDFPEVSGIYSDPTHPNLLVRVFVHPEKPTRNLDPVCINDDSSAITGPVGWVLPSGSWTYHVNSSSAPSSIRSNVGTIVSTSFASWNQALGGSSSKPTLVEGSSTSINRSRYDGQNVIAWGRTSRSALAVTYTWYYPSTGFAAEEDTIVNSRVSWSWSPTCGANSYDAQNVLTHEFGHWYGLNDEYTTPYLENTMYGYASKGETKKDTLTTGDAQGLQTLYP